MKKTLAVILGLIVLFIVLKLVTSKNSQTHEDNMNAAITSTTLEELVPGAGGTQSAAVSTTLTSGAVAGGGLVPLKKFFEQYPGQWTYTKRPDGKYGVIQGGQARNIAVSETAVQNWVKELVPTLGIPATQVGPTAISSKTDSIHTYYSTQVADGFEVFYGGVLVAARADDGSIFMVDSQLQEVGPFNPHPAIARDEAFLIVLKQYNGKRVQSLKDIKTPVVFTLNGKDKTELAWQFEISVKGDSDYDERRVLVGTQSKTVVLDQRTLKN